MHTTFLYPDFCYIIHNSYDTATKYLAIRDYTCEVILPGYQYWLKQRIFPHDLLVANLLNPAATDIFIFTI